MATDAEVMSVISELSAKVDGLKPLVDIAIKFTDSHHAIIWASELDNALELALLSKMRRLNSDMKEKIFDGYGPLSNFAGKIDIAYALEIVSNDFYDSLRKINKVRVKFAHPKKFLSFEDTEISAIIDSLPNLDLTIANRKQRYLKKIAELKSYLEQIAENRRGDHAIESHS
jgi:DNA-binding MltR family transcriptional regulator